MRKDYEERIKQLEVSIDMMRTIVAKLQMDMHTLQSQQYLRDWTINGK